MVLAKRLLVCFLLSVSSLFSITEVIEYSSSYKKACELYFERNVEACFPYKPHDLMKQIDKPGNASYLLLKNKKVVGTLILQKVKMVSWDPFSWTSHYLHVVSIVLNRPFLSEEQVKFFFDQAIAHIRKKIFRIWYIEAVVFEWEEKYYKAAGFEKRQMLKFQDIHQLTPLFLYKRPIMGASFVRFKWLGSIIKMIIRYMRLCGVFLNGGF